MNYFFESSSVNAVLHAVTYGVLLVFILISLYISLLPKHGGLRNIYNISLFERCVLVVALLAALIVVAALILFNHLVLEIYLITFGWLTICGFLSGYALSKLFGKKKMQ